MVGVITVTLLIVFAMFGFGWAVLLGFIWWVLLYNSLVVRAVA